MPLPQVTVFSSIFYGIPVTAKREFQQRNREPARSISANMQFLGWRNIGGCETVAHRE